jgi:hypothetical protein
MVLQRRVKGKLRSDAKIRFSNGSCLVRKGGNVDI